MYEKFEMVITERGGRKKLWIMKKTGKKMKLKSWGFKLKCKASSAVMEMKTLEVYKELTRIAVKLWGVELDLFLFWYVNRNERFEVQLWRKNFAGKLLKGILVFFHCCLAAEQKWSAWQAAGLSGAWRGLWEWNAKFWLPRVGVSGQGISAGSEKDLHVTGISERICLVLLINASNVRWRRQTFAKWNEEAESIYIKEKAL